MQRPTSWVRDHRRPLVVALALFAIALLLAASDYRPEVPLALTALGVVALLFRTAVRVDARREAARVVWTIAGVPVLPLRRVLLANVRAVRIERKRRKKRTIYRVGLQFSPQRTRHVWSGTDLLRARRFGERVALGLSLPLHDGSTGRFRTRDPWELELTLGERLRREGPEPALPVRPETSTLTLRAGPASVIEFPGQRLSLALKLVWLLAPTFFLVLFWLVSTERTAPVLLPIPAFILVAFVWALLNAARSKFVTVSGGVVEVRAFGSRTRRMSLSDLEELVLAPDGLHLVADEAHVVIPSGWMESSGDDRFVAGVIEHAAYRHALGAGPVRVPWAEPREERHWEPVPDGAPPPAAPDRPRRRGRPPERILLGFGCLFLAVGLGGSALATHLVLESREFLARAAVTDGTVIELVRSRGTKRRTVYRPKVRYVLPSGTPVVFTSSAGSNPPPYDVGDRVEVRYDPANPRDAKVGSIRNVLVLPFLVCGLALGMTIAGISSLRWYRAEVREAAAAAPVTLAPYDVGPPRQLTDEPRPAKTTPSRS